ncbi:hypothetical protein [Zavarzinia aquatilis]|uniref:Uncharacterized protein n=1 Tax=Zavarzinia aquatilis TaxID=2211142 RepID=A0A317EGA2_9PROT|nr:hypothetical protein [Zavarzinia aquatilis]PWR25334.1 hypothetical protein DKG74_06115 [Zavarzinia aquatilis]
MAWTLRIYKALIWLSLYGAALHFFDNVYFFDQYPEPAWLNPVAVAALLIPLVLLAHRAVDYIYIGKADRSYSLVHGFVSGSWLSLGHYLFASPAQILPRINIIIAIQVGLATVLFVYALWLQLSRSPSSIRYTGRAWAKNIALYAVAIVILETLWPSRFSDWWTFW